MKNQKSKEEEGPAGVDVGNPHLTPTLTRTQLWPLVQERLSLDDARRAREIFLLAGDTHLFAITTFDGAKVGDGTIGPVAKACIALLKQDAVHGSENHQPL